jgi:hypothetical protein
MDSEPHEQQKPTWLEKHTKRASEIAGAILESEALVVSDDPSSIVTLNEKAGLTALQHQAAFLMGHGCELDEVAAHLGVPEASVHGWIIGHDVFNQALQHYTRVFSEDVGRKATQLVRGLIEDPTLETKNLLVALKLALEVRKQQSVSDILHARYEQLERHTAITNQQRERGMDIQERALMARVAGVGVSHADSVEIHGSSVIDGVIDLGSQPVTVEPAKE